MKNQNQIINSSKKKIEQNQIINSSFKNFENLSLIVAYSKNSKLKKNVIGKNKKIPWNIPEDLQRFKNLTTENIVIMGRKTFEEIFEKLKKPLPNRINIVISSTKDFSKIGVKTFKNLFDAINFSTENFPQKEIFICGGQSLYNESIQFVKKMYITEILQDFDGDVFFPLFSQDSFDIIEETKIDGAIPYKNFTYLRKAEIK